MEVLWRDVAVCDSDVAVCDSDVAVCSSDVAVCDSDVAKYISYEYRSRVYLHEYYNYFYLNMLRIYVINKQQIINVQTMIFTRYVITVTAAYKVP